MQAYSDNAQFFGIRNYSQNGVAVIRDFFSKTDVDYFYELEMSQNEYSDPAKNYLEKTKACISDVRMTEQLISHEILKIVSDVSNVNTPIYFGHMLCWHRKPLDEYSSGIDLSFSDALSKIIPPYDAKAHIDAKGKEGNILGVRHGIVEKHTVVRLGWFPQSFSSKSLGMRVYPGTHIDSLHKPNQEPVYLDITDRDLVVFSLKSIHSAMGLLPKYSKQARPELWELTPSDELVLRKKQPMDFMPSPNSRNAIFWDFASSDRMSELFIRNRAFFNSTEQYVGDIGAYNLRTNPHLVALEKSGRLCLREDINLIWSLRNFKKVRPSQGGIERLVSRVNDRSIVPIQDDFQILGPLEVSGSAVTR